MKNNDDFLKSETAQNTAAQKFFAGKEESLRRTGTFNHVGQDVNGVKGDFKVSEAGLLAAAHRDGEGAVKAYIEHQKKNNWRSQFDNLDKGVKEKFDLKDKDGTVIRTAEDRFRAIETRIRMFEKVKW